MKEIKLTKGYVAMVDDDDYEYLNQWKWYYHNGYAVRNKCQNHNSMRMHRIILKINDRNILVDHINRDKLDNRKNNLRQCDAHGNSRNRSKVKNASSIYLGVYYEATKRGRKKYHAQIRINGKQTHIGRYLTEKEAGMAYNKMALIHFKEFASLNIIN